MPFEDLKLKSVKIEQWRPVLNRQSFGAYGTGGKLPENCWQADVGEAPGVQEHRDPTVFSGSSTP